MAGHSKSDFAALLDDLIVEAEERQQGASRAMPNLRHDLLEQIDRLQGESAPGGTEQFRVYTELAAEDFVAPEPEATETATLEPALEDLFFLDPGTIARELGIVKGSTPDELDKARRTFAMRYHPDRMPEEMRDRAKMRMQIANMLIDEAKRHTS